MLKHFLKNFAAILLSIFLLAGNCWAGITFDKVDDIINCASGTSLDNMSTRTYSAWIYPTSIGENSIGYILGKVGGTNAFSWNMIATSTIGFTHTGTTTLQRTADNNLITLNSWQHVLMTWDGVLTTASSVHIYINGTEVGYQTSTNGSGTINDAAGNLCIGNRDTDTARTFDGTISEVAIWNVVLTAPQIALLASSRIKGMPLQIQSSALKGYWSLDSGTHGNSADLDTAWDLSGNGNNGNPDNGANNTGLTWAAEQILSQPSQILSGQ